MTRLVGSVSILSITGRLNLVLLADDSTVFLDNRLIRNLRLNLVLLADDSTRTDSNSFIWRITASIWFFWQMTRHEFRGSRIRPDGRLNLVLLADDST